MDFFVDSSNSPGYVGGALISCGEEVGEQEDEREVGEVRFEQRRGLGNVNDKRD